MSKLSGAAASQSDRISRRVRRRGSRILGSAGLEKPARAALGRYRTRRSDRSSRPDEARRWLATRHEVQTILAGDGPVVVGPWLSELGFEVLYWVPFLRWLSDRFDIDPDRLHVVSRGGTASWYSGVANHYLDILDFCTPSEFRHLTEERWQALGGQKQMEMTKFDRNVLKLMRDQLEWDRRSVLHPSLMYNLFRSFWKDAAPIDHILRHTRFEPFSPPSAEPWASRLPDGDFVAAKFYFRPSFPEAPANREAVSDAISRLAEQTDVVLLNTGLEIDDHLDIDPGVEGRVTWMLDDVPPSQNLHVQSLAISRASGFVGTYGGLSYLAPMYGIRSLAYYSEPQHFLMSHLELARCAAHRTGGSLLTISTKESQLFGLLGAPSEDAPA